MISFGTVTDESYCLRPKVVSRLLAAAKIESSVDALGRLFAKFRATEKARFVATVVQL